MMSHLESLLISHNKAQTTGKTNNLVNDDGVTKRYKLLTDANTDKLKNIDQKTLNKIQGGMSTGWSSFHISIETTTLPLINERLILLLGKM